MSNKKNLRKELLNEGASKNEAETLARLAEQLTTVKPRGLSEHAKREIFAQLPMNEPAKPRPVFRWAFAGSLAGAMALLALVILPAMLQNNSARPTESEIRTLVQPVETELEQLDTQIEQLQSQETINEVELQETEKKYQDTFEKYKKQYENKKEFKNYDWNKWQRTWLRNYQQNQDSNQVNGTSTTRSGWWQQDSR